MNKADSRHDIPDSKQWTALASTIIMIGIVIVWGLIGR